MLKDSGVTTKVTKSLFISKQPQEKKLRRRLKMTTMGHFTWLICQRVTDSITWRSKWMDNRWLVVLGVFTWPHISTRPSRHLAQRGLVKDSLSIQGECLWAALGTSLLLITAIKESKYLPQKVNTWRSLEKKEMLLKHWVFLCQWHTSLLTTLLWTTLSCRKTTMLWRQRNLHHVVTSERGPTYCDVREKSAMLWRQKEAKMFWRQTFFS